MRKSPAMAMTIVVSVVAPNRAVDLVQGPDWAWVAKSTRSLTQRKNSLTKERILKEVRR